MATKRPCPVRPFTTLGIYGPRRPRGRARSFKFTSLFTTPPEELL